MRAHTKSNGARPYGHFSTTNVSYDITIMAARMANSTLAENHTYKVNKRIVIQILWLQNSFLIVTQYHKYFSSGNKSSLYIGAYHHIFMIK